MKNMTELQPVQYIQAQSNVWAMAMNHLTFGLRLSGSRDDQLVKAL